MPPRPSDRHWNFQSAPQPRIPADEGYPDFGAKTMKGVGPRSTAICRNSVPCFYCIPEARLTLSGRNEAVRRLRGRRNQFLGNAFSRIVTPKKSRPSGSSYRVVRGNDHENACRAWAHLVQHVAEPIDLQSSSGESTSSRTQIGAGRDRHPRDLKRAAVRPDSRLNQDARDELLCLGGLGYILQPGISAGLRRQRGGVRPWRLEQGREPMT